MRYISPFHFIQEDLFRYGFVDANKKQSELKNILAQSETNTIHFQNNELDKNDIIHLFSNLDNAEILNIHTHIFRDKLLLHFLENGFFATGLNATFNPNLSNQNAIAFISPYYKQAAIDAIKNAVEQKDENTIIQFFSVSHLLTQHDSLDLIEHIKATLQLPFFQLNVLIDKVKENELIISKEEILVLELNKISNVYNKFPIEYNSSREELANILNRLGCAFAHQKYFEFAQYVFKAALTINTATNTKNQLTKNFEVVSNKNNNTQSKTRTKESNKIIAIPIIFAILIVVRVIYGIWFTSTHKQTSKIDEYVNYTNSSNNNTVVNDANEVVVEDNNDVEISKPINYDAFNESNTSFDDFMTLLYNQSIMFSPTDRKQIAFKNGDNVYKSLFDAPAFIVPGTRAIKNRATSTITKTVKIINNTEYECVIITRNTILAVPVEFNSSYIPAKSSLNLMVKDGYTDIRPYLGNKLIINKYYNRASITERRINADFIPNYLFETVPRKNKLLFGIGVTFDEIKESNAKITIEQINGELIQNIDELKN
jgi:hypothetical protein